MRRSQHLPLSRPARGPRASLEELEADPSAVGRGPGGLGGPPSAHSSAELLLPWAPLPDLPALKMGKKNQQRFSLKPSPPLSLSFSAPFLRGPHESFIQTPSFTPPSALPTLFSPTIFEEGLPSKKKKKEGEMKKKKQRRKERPIKGNV